MVHRLQPHHRQHPASEAGHRAVPTVAGPVKLIDPGELARELEGERPPLVVDVREPEEFQGPLGHVPGARLIPLDELAGHAAELGPFANRPIVLVCRSGARSLAAGALLRQSGFHDVASLDGGMLAWNEEDRASER